MFGLLALFWSAFAVDELQVVGADLPEGVYYDCNSITPAANADGAKKAQARYDCINTGWCVWFDNTCSIDRCLRILSKEGTLNDCPKEAGYTCNIHYITDIHDCGTKQNPGTGEQTDYADVYCRINQTGYDKEPIDKCFYDDFANRTNGGSGSCGSRPCAWNGTSSTSSPGRYCRATNAQVCTDVLDNLPAFCSCLGSTDGGKFCNLHPNCYLNDQNQCVEDQCRNGTAQTNDTCSNVINTNDCGGRYEYSIDPTNGNVILPSLKCANKKSKNANTCFRGISATVDRWQTPQNLNPDAEDGIWPDCQKTTIVNKCTELTAYNYTSSFPGQQTTKCEVAQIPSGWFAGSEICIDHGRSVPSVSGGTRLSIPSLFVILMVVISFANYLL